MGEIQTKQNGNTSDFIWLLYSWKNHYILELCKNYFEVIFSVVNFLAQIFFTHTDVWWETWCHRWGWWMFFVVWDRRTLALNNEWRSARGTRPPTLVTINNTQKSFLRKSREVILSSFRTKVLMMIFFVCFALKLLFKTKLQGASLYVKKMLSEEGGFARGIFLYFTFPLFLSVSALHTWFLLENPALWCPSLL